MAMLLSAANAVTRQAKTSKDAPMPCDLRISLRKDGPDRSNDFTYHPGDVLSGHLTFFHGVAVAILQVVVTLEGTMRTWVDHEHYASAAKYDFLKQSQQVPRQEHISQSRVDGECAIMPFKFIIASQCLPNDELGPRLSSLPPTFQAGSPSQDQQGNRCMQPLIEYCINATIIYRCHNEERLQRLRRLRIFTFAPWSEAEPPLSLDDFPGEFTTTVTQEMRKGLFRTSCSEVTIVADEPRPLPSLQDGSPGHTEGMLKITLTTARQLSADALQSPYWSCQVHVELTRHTYYTSMPIREVASRRLLKENKYLRARKEIVLTSAWSVNPLCWDRTISRQDAHNIVSEAYIPIPIRPTSRLVSTFASPLVTVRYSLQVELRIQQVAHSPLVVEVPLQVYCPRKRSDERRGCRDSLSTVGPAESTSPPSYYL